MYELEKKLVLGWIRERSGDAPVVIEADGLDCGGNPAGLFIPAPQPSYMVEIFSDLIEASNTNPSGASNGTCDGHAVLGYEVPGLLPPVDWDARATEFLAKLETAKTTTIGSPRRAAQEAVSE